MVDISRGWHGPRRALAVLWAERLGANLTAAGLCGHLERSSSRGAARAAEVVGSPEYDPCEGCAAGQPSHQRHMVGAYVFECEKAGAP